MSALEKAAMANTFPDGAQVIRSVHDYIGRFVAYPSKHTQVAHAIWIMHTHLMEAWDSTPRIAFLSPEPGSGKSRALEVTEPLVPRAVEAVNVTPAYLFRKVGDEDGRPTILFDEIDTLFGPRAKENEEIRGLLNAGHRRHSTTGRCVVRGKQVFTEEIPAYCAVALAGLGDLPDTIMTRAIVVRMRRRAPHEAVEPYRRRVELAEATRLHDQISTWARSVEEEAADYLPPMPERIVDRNADVWEALLACADLAGGEWPELARVAAVALVADSMAGSHSLGVQLLIDLHRVFGDEEALSTDTLIERLVALEDSPWSDLRGKPLDSRGLSRRLRQYDVKPVVVRIGNKTPRGYRRQDLHDPWARYLPRSPDTAPLSNNATSATSNTESLAGDFWEPQRESATSATIPTTADAYLAAKGGD